MTVSQTKSAIVETADNLFYETGFEATSFADIAKKVGISRGNFYHHFKSKDQILTAVIEHRLGKTKNMLEDWENQGETARDRIISFIEMLITNRAKIMAFGCPVGTLYTELAKLEHASRSHSVEILQMFKSWLEQQLRTFAPSANTEKSALHLLTWSQGVASIASAYQDEDYIKDEVAKISNWLDTLNTSDHQE